MTITTNQNTDSAAGDGATVAFPVTAFKVLETVDVQVILHKADGRELVQTVTTHYSVVLATPAALPSTFTVTMVTAPAAGETVEFRLNRDLGKQDAALPTSGPLPTKTLENTGLDHLQLQANTRKWERAHYGGDQDAELVLNMGTIGTTYTLTAHEEKFPVIRLTGSPGGAMTLTFTGNTEQRVSIINEADEAVTVAPDGSPTQSIVVATLKAAMLYVDGPGSKTHRLVADVTPTA